MAATIESISLAMTCSVCGGSRLEIDAPANDEALTHCSDCGETLGAWSEVKEQARAAMFDAMRDDFAGLRPMRTSPAHNHGPATHAAPAQIM